MKMTNRINKIRFTVAAGLILAAAGAAAGECTETSRPNYAEMVGPSIRLQAAEAMTSIQDELRLTAEDVTPVALQVPVTTLVAEGEVSKEADKSS